MTEWQIVPKEPIDEMLNAAKREVHGSNGARDKAKRVFKSMLAVAPKPEPILWYSLLNGDVEHNYKPWMGDNWIPLYALKETS